MGACHVNEVGTEAVATTAVVMNPGSMSSVLRVDHPFIFLIRENQTGSILFLGRVVDPTSAASPLLTAVPVRGFMNP
jgi:serine protease inhibitor